MNNGNQVFFTVFYIFCAVMVARSIYKAFFAKLETPNDYMNRANYAVSFFRARNYAIKLLEKGLVSIDKLTDEENSFMHFQIGINLYAKRKFNEAAKHFDIAWPYLKKSKIPYNKIYASIVATYYNIGQKDKAREVYHYLMQKEKYDPRFGALQYLENSIFK